MPPPPCCPTPSSATDSLQYEFSSSVVYIQQLVPLSGLFSSSLSDVEENGIRREACNNMKQLTEREVFHKTMEP